MAAAFAAGVLGGGIGATSASFTATTANGTNSFDAADDWTAPAVGSSVIAKTAGGVTGRIKQGGTYFVYANVTDGGNPASGTATVRADVSAITTGATAVALSSGSFTAGGTTYNYRSASQTAKNPLAAGTYTYTIATTDSAGNSATTGGFSVVVDNTAPSASDVQTANGGSIAGRPDAGDRIVLTFSEAMDPESILASWTGASTNVVVRFTNANPDLVAVWNSSNSAQLPLGVVSLGRTDYVNANITFGATGTPSTMVMSGSTITITLGTQSAAGTTAAGTGTLAWVPSATATDGAGNACSTTSRNETGGADKDF